jgi:osmotically-inducible protein OsmY
MLHKTTNTKRRKPMNRMNRVIVATMAVALLVIGIPFHASATEEDDRIEAAFQQSYVFQTYLKDDAINIDSADGVVTLTGSVAKEPSRSLAAETVAGLPGVRSVDNRITVTEKETSVNADAWVSMKVKTALLFHRNVSATTEVNTKNGIVTLQGEAESNAQKDLTAEYVKDVEGVKCVQNEMTVASGPMTSAGKTLGKKN